MIHYQIVQKNAREYIECLPGGECVASGQDALELVAICGEHRINLLMLSHAYLTEDFYHLSSGVAGEILLKLTNYRIKAAAILTPEQVGQGKFKEMVIETNRGKEFYVAFDRQAAEDWLLKD